MILIINFTCNIQRQLVYLTCTGGTKAEILKHANEHNLVKQAKEKRKGLPKIFSH